MKLSKKLALNSVFLKFEFCVLSALKCSPFEVFYGDYRFNTIDECKFKAILGNADFSGCENLDISELQYVQGNLNLNDTQNVSLGVQFVGKNVFGIGSYGISLNSLQEVGEGVFMDVSSVHSLANLEKAKCLYLEPQFVQHKSTFVAKNAHVKKETSKTFEDFSK